jgi:hypothetical protein
VVFSRLLRRRCGRWMRNQHRVRRGVSRRGPSRVSVPADAARLACRAARRTPPRRQRSASGVWLHGAESACEAHGVQGQNRLGSASCFADRLDSVRGVSSRYTERLLGGYLLIGVSHRNCGAPVHHPRTGRAPSSAIRAPVSALQTCAGRPTRWRRSATLHRNPLAGATMDHSTHVRVMTSAGLKARSAPPRAPSRADHRRARRVSRAPA